MKYSETGFRALYKNFVAFPLTAAIREAVGELPTIDQADYVLMYGFINNEAGLYLEVLSGARRDGESFVFFEPNFDTRVLLPLPDVENEDFFYFDDPDGSLHEKFAAKLQALEEYETSEDVEESRKMDFLDASRHPYFPDVLQVYLAKDGFEPEEKMVRIMGLGDTWFMGILLEEPDQDFGFHAGNPIAFVLQKAMDETIICVADLNESDKLTAEDLENGVILKNAVTTFNTDRTEVHLVQVLELMRDSFFWIPCNAVLSDEDQTRLEAVLKQNQENVSTLVGKSFENKDLVRLVPDILESEGEYFFPIFTTEEDMGEYGDHFSKVQKSMLECIALAKKNEKELVGIVLNAFTEPFVLSADLFDIVANMDSHLA